MKILNIIDSFGLFFKLYYAMMGLKSIDNKPSGMISGFATFIKNLQRDFPCDYLVFALEGGKTFRDEIYPLYKANRKDAPIELKEQLVVCIDMIKKMGFASISKNSFEADDVIASLVKTYKNECKINIISTDKDLFALIDENVRIIDTKKKISYDASLCYEKFGVYPSQIKDYLSIVGDSSDNVPGIKGLGERGARVLLEEFGTLENIYKNLEKITNLRTKNALISSRENALLSEKLITLNSDIQMPCLDKFLLPENPLANVKDILQSYSINKILNKLDEENIFTSNVKTKNSNANLEFQAILIQDEKTLNSILSNIKENDLVAFDTETTGLDSKTAKIIGFSFAINNEAKAYYVPIAHNYLGAPSMLNLNQAKTAIQKIFQAKVIGHNLKYDFDIVKNNFNIEFAKNYADTMILSWLKNPEQSHSMDNIAKRIFNYETIKFEDIVPKTGNFSEVDVNIACKYASEDAFITMKFYEYFLQNLENHLLRLATDVEFPFIKTLLTMQNSGIKANLLALNEFNLKLTENIAQVQKEIYSFTKTKFNLNSPKQLGVVLFEELGLSSTKKNKTGYSTNENTLKMLEHPIIPLILDYRELNKLKTTYIEPFIKLCKDGKRIYTNFMQTGTATGRLSSICPNLQNIPARGQYAKQTRSCFIPDDGKLFISLDYSQIELRLLAHFSKDEALIKAFNDGADIHAQTAINIFGQSDNATRNIAKSINFGLIYGMGANKLAQNLGISNAQAKEYINKYFTNFPSIKNYLQDIKNTAKSCGFVSTILGRKRFFDFSKANAKEQALFEREAVNTIFQGSAADIIKLAMNKIQAFLNDDIKMILQIHDELIFEVPSQYAQEFALKAANIMQNILQLNVALVVNYQIGQNWGELK